MFLKLISLVKNLSNLSTEEKERINKFSELSYLTSVAIGHRTIGEFTRECGRLDTKVIEDILDCKIYEFPHRKILFKIANVSEERITYKQLLNACNYSEYDQDDMSFIKFNPRRGDIYYVDLGFGIDSEQKGCRPCIIVQNNTGNKFSSLITIIPLTSKIKRLMPTHVVLSLESGLLHESIALAEQLKSVSKRRLFFNEVPIKVGQVPEYLMSKIDTALEKQLGLISVFYNEEEAFLKLDKLSNSTCKLTKADLLKDFKTYCIKYDKNAKEIYEEYRKVVAYNRSSMVAVCN